MGKIQIDSTDRKILSLLINNSRMPFLEIARECGISGAAIHQRVKKLEDSGVIIGSRLVVNPKILGFDVCAFVGIHLTDPRMDTGIVEGLAAIDEIVEVHFVTGQFNILTRVYCRDNNHLMTTIFEKIFRINGVIRTETFISLKESFSRQVCLEGLDAETEE